MQIETDLREIREMAILFLLLDISETKFPFLASHPFTDSWFTCLPKGGNKCGEIVDLHDEEMVKEWRCLIKQEIEKASLFELFMMMSKPYILIFIKYIERFLSDEDLGFVLKEFWNTIEQISLDSGVTGKNIVKWFSRATKDSLMDEDELKLFDNLPEEITIYRGVTAHNKSQKKALSWSTDRKVATWFAERFQTETGEVWELTVPKERILCCFEGRNEHEVIVNLYGFTSKPKVYSLAT